MKKKRNASKWVSLGLGVLLAAGISLGLTGCGGGQSADGSDTVSETSIGAEANGDHNTYSVGTVSTQNGKRHYGGYSRYIMRVETKGVKPHRNQDKNQGQQSNGQNSGGISPSDVDLTGIDTTKPMIALTFDDGPGAGTEKILQILQENDAKATFFEVGTSIQNYPELSKKLADAGMQMASHTWDHPDMTSLSDSEIEKTLSKTAAEMEKATGGTTPSALRPPYGAVDDNVKSQVNLPIILWSIDTLDWSSRDADAICQKVDAADPGDGDIILFHDIYESTADAVARLVPQLKAKGFQLVTVEQMFAAKNKELKNGTVYCDSYE